jgi:DNA-binding beta-propeller fold protein YncE
MSGTAAEVRAWYNTPYASVGLASTRPIEAYPQFLDLLDAQLRDGGTVMEINWRTMTTVRTFTLGVQTLGMEMAPDQSELYVTTQFPTALYIVNLSNGAISSAPVQAGASTIALSADGTQLYVGKLFAGQVEVLDRASRAHVRTIPTGGVVREMITDPSTQPRGGVE